MRILVSSVTSAVMVCLALGCSSSDDSGGTGGAAGAGGSGGSTAGGDYQGTCDRPSDGLCVDNYCSGSSCASLLPDAQSSCTGTWSQTKCAGGAIGKCTLTTVGWTAMTSYYTGNPADIQTACTSVGGTFSN